MLQQDSQNRLRTNLVYNRNLGKRSFAYRMRFSQVREKDYKKILNGIAWGVAGALTFYSALHFGVLALFTGYSWLGLSFINSSPVSHIASGAIMLFSGCGAAIFSSLSAFCFKHISSST